MHFIIKVDIVLVKTTNQIFPTIILYFLTFYFIFSYSVLIMFKQILTLVFPLCQASEGRVGESLSRAEDDEK